MAGLQTRALILTCFLKLQKIPEITSVVKFIITETAADMFYTELLLQTSFLETPRKA